MHEAKEKKGAKKMTGTFWFMLGLVGLLSAATYRRDPALVLEGAKAGGLLFVDILPVMLVAFLAAGMITQILPKDLLTRWLGAESGLRGMLIASTAGALMPGGPFVQFPIVAALLKGGAGVAQMMSFVSAWSLFGINRLLVWEVPLLGWKLALCRVAASLIFAPIIGAITQRIWSSL